MSPTKQVGFGIDERSKVVIWTGPTWSDPLGFHVLPLPAVGVLQFTGVTRQTCSGSSSNASFGTLDVM